MLVFNHRTRDLLVELREKSVAFWHARVSALAMRSILGEEGGMVLFKAHQQVFWSIGLSNHSSTISSTCLPEVFVFF